MRSRLCAWWRRQSNPSEAGRSPPSRDVLGSSHPGGRLEFARPDCAIGESSFDLGAVEDVPPVHDSAVAHPPPQFLQVQGPVVVVRRDQCKAVRPLQSGSQIPGDRKPSQALREWVVNRHIRPPTPQFPDERDRGAVPRVLRVLAERESEDGNLRVPDSPSDLPHRLFDELRHPCRHEVVHLPRRRNQDRLLITDGRHEEPWVLRDTLPSDARARYEHVSARTRVHELPHAIGVRTEFLADQSDLVRERNLYVSICVLRGLRNLRAHPVCVVERTARYLRVQSPCRSASAGILRSDDAVQCREIAKELPSRHSLRRVDEMEVSPRTEPAAPLEDRANKARHRSWGDCRLNGDESAFVKPWGDAAKG